MIAHAAILNQLFEMIQSLIPRSRVWWRNRGRARAECGVWGAGGAGGNWARGGRAWLRFTERAKRRSRNQGGLGQSRWALLVRRGQRGRSVPGRISRARR